MTGTTPVNNSFVGKFDEKLRNYIKKKLTEITHTQPSIQKGVKNENHMICYLVLLFQIIYDVLVTKIGILQ